MLGQARYGHYVNTVGKIATGCIYIFPDIRLLICNQHLRVWEQRASWQPKMFPLMLTCQSIAYPENLKLASVNSSGHADLSFRRVCQHIDHQSMVLPKSVCLCPLIISFSVSFFSCILGRYCLGWRGLENVSDRWNDRAFTAVTWETGTHVG